jgi:DNA-binding PucR family transcriptional regulator
MTYASTILTRELQKAVQQRQQAPVAVTSTLPRSLAYSVSSPAREHLEKLRTYRERSKTISVGRY